MAVYSESSVSNLPPFAPLCTMKGLEKTSSLTQCFYKQTHFHHFKRKPTKHKLELFIVSVVNTCFNK